MPMPTFIKARINKKIDANEHRIPKVQLLDIEWRVYAWEAGCEQIMTPMTVIEFTLKYVDKSGDEHSLPPIRASWSEMQEAFPGIHESILRS